MNDRLAIDGGTPIRGAMLPYSHQTVDEQDVQSVVEVLRSDWLTTGPKVAEFERCLADTVGAVDAVSVSSGTAALHTAMFALEIGPGDEVIVPAITFASTANAVLFQGGRPVFADLNPDTLLLDPERVEAMITPKTKAIIAVDYAGQPCDYDALRAVSDRHGLPLVADACHALGGSYKDRPVGTLGDLNVFSFHPVKHVAAGEGGAVVTDDKGLAQRMRTFRNHGISTDHHQRARHGLHSYEMEYLGYNYRLSDIQCALALSQLDKLPDSIRRRQAIAERYDTTLAETPTVTPLAVNSDVTHAYHIYPVQVDLDRDKIFAALRAENIGVNVHYLPVYRHPYYQRQGYTKGLCPVAEAAYERMISLPIFPGMTDEDVGDVLTAVEKVVGYYLA